jgi:hypothetical protein
MIGGRKWSLFKRLAEYRTKKDHKSTKIPQKFASIAEARDSLNFRRYHASYSIALLPHPSETDTPSSPKPSLLLPSPTLSAWKSENMMLFEQWLSVFEAWMEEHNDTMTDRERMACKVLGIIKNVCYVSLCVVRRNSDDQTVWDVFNPQFEEAVQLAEEVLLHPPSASLPVDCSLSSLFSDTILTQGRTSTTTMRTPTFSLDMEIVGPIYDVASRCRDPIIRRRAIHVLKTCARQEGMWNAALTARVAERVVQIEEMGLGCVRSCEDVPDWARISNVQPVFEKEGRRARISYRRMGMEGDGERVRKMVEEVVEW